MNIVREDCGICARGVSGMQRRLTEELLAGCIDWQVPEHTAAALHDYIVHRIPPGGFLYAVLTNNLADAIGRADSMNAAALKEIVGLIYNNIPSPAWKTPEAVAAWLSQADEQSIALRTADESAGT